MQTLMMPTAITKSTNNTMLPEDIATAINSSFGNFSAFEKNMTETALGVFGSGWAWLTYNPKTKALAVEPTANQDNPLSAGLNYSGNTPLLVSILILSALPQMPFRLCNRETMPECRAVYWHHSAMHVLQSNAWMLCQADQKQQSTPSK